MWKCVGGYLGMLFEWLMFVGGCVVLRQWVIFCVGLGDVVFIGSVRVVLCE